MPRSRWPRICGKIHKVFARLPREVLDESRSYGVNPFPCFIVKAKQALVMSLSGGLSPASRQSTSWKLSRALWACLPHHSFQLAL